MKALIISILLLFSLAASAQDKNSYRFAQTYVGYKASYLNHFGSQTVAPHLNQNLTIGGLHFWGKADFYVTFPVGLSTLGKESNYSYTEGVQTGGRWIPFGLSNKSPRLYLGAHWNNPSINSDAGAYYSQAGLGLETGIVLVVKKSWSVELGAHYTVANSFDYFTFRTASENVQIPNVGFDFGVKKYFDFTRSLEKESSQKFLAETYVEMKDKKHLNAWELAAGPSSSIPLTELGYLQGIDWLPNKPLIAINPDLSLGFYFHKPDMVVRAAYRPITKFTSGHDLAVQFKENRVPVKKVKKIIISSSSQTVSTDNF
ncbi:MAG: hypothetical protein KDC92_15890, partial [Bacteroidetes bacterium]|nr:hypothetical protein [Bacteroidota bacterium]